jgi:hypothetical protein
MTSDNILVMLTPAEVNIVRQSLRAEHDRMVRQGFSGLAKLAEETSSKVSDAMLDKKLSVG